MARNPSPEPSTFWDMVQRGKTLKLLDNIRGVNCGMVHRSVKTNSDRQMILNTVAVRTGLNRLTFVGRAFQVQITVLVQKSPCRQKGRRGYIWRDLMCCINSRMISYRIRPQKSGWGKNESA